MARTCTIPVCQLLNRGSQSSHILLGSTLRRCRIAQPYINATDPQCGYANNGGVGGDEVAFLCEGLR
jgi:hypothetical protein